MRKLLVASCVVTLVLAASPPAGWARGTALTSTENALLQAVNAARAAHLLAPLTIDPRLERAARAHSYDMLRNHYFSHGSFVSRLMRFHVRGPRIGENLAWGTGLVDPTTAVSWWLASPGHRANLLRPGFRRIGLGAPVGRYVGSRRATVITADFAGR
jgi:uncharacterized protein YkwD